MLWIYMQIHCLEGLNLETLSIAPFINFFFKPNIAQSVTDRQIGPKGPLPNHLETNYTYTGKPVYSAPLYLAQWIAGGTFGLQALLRALGPLEGPNNSKRVRRM